MSAYIFLKEEHESFLKRTTAGSTILSATQPLECPPMGPLSHTISTPYKCTNQRKKTSTHLPLPSRHRDVDKPPRICDSLLRTSLGLHIHISNHISSGDTALSIIFSRAHAYRLLLLLRFHFRGLGFDFSCTGERAAVGEEKISKHSYRNLGEDRWRTGLYPCLRVRYR